MRTLALLLALLATIGTALEDGGVFDLSPDGTRVLTVRGTNVDIWLYDFARGTNRRLTGGNDMDVNPRWTGDGSRFVYQAMMRRNSSASTWSTVRMHVDGGDVDTLARDGAVMPEASRDGSTLVFTRFGPDDWNLFKTSLTGDRNEVQLTHGGVNFGARFSPNGKWIAFQRSEGLPSPRPTLMLMPLDHPGEAITVGIGLWPNWNERGDRLYFLQGDDVMEVTVGQGNPPAIGRPVRLFTRPRTDVPMVFDWKPQFAVRGDRFLVLKPVEASQPAGIVLVENWTRR